MLDGRGFCELTIAHNRVTPFVSVNMNFLPPITLRVVLVLTVHVAKLAPRL